MKFSFFFFALGFGWLTMSKGYNLNKGIAIVKNEPRLLDSSRHDISKKDSTLTTWIHIFGVGSPLSAWNYKFTINGVALKLKPGHCLEYSLIEDSVRIEIINKPFPHFKSQAPINLTLEAKEDLYIYFNSAEPIEEFPFTTMAVKEMCKECYEKLSKKCK